MAGLNRAQLIGNVGKEPEIRYMQNGDPIMNFSLATTETWKDKSGAKQEKTEWHRVEVFGALAKSLSDYITKGKKLFVEGKIVYEEWTDKDGNKRNTTKIKVAGFGSNIILLDKGGSGSAPAKRDVQSGGSGTEIPDKPFQAGDDDVPF